MRLLSAQTTTYIYRWCWTATPIIPSPHSQQWGDLGLAHTANSVRRVGPSPHSEECWDLQFRNIWRAALCPGLIGSSLLLFCALTILLIYNDCNRAFKVVKFSGNDFTSVMHPLVNFHGPVAIWTKNSNVLGHHSCLLHHTGLQLRYILSDINISTKASFPRLARYSRYEDSKWWLWLE